MEAKKGMQQQLALIQEAFDVHIEELTEALGQVDRLPKHHLPDPIRVLYRAVVAKVRNQKKKTLRRRLINILSLLVRLS